MKIFSTLANALNAKGQTSKQLSAAVEVAKKANEEAKAALAAVQAQRVEALGASDAERSRFRQRLAEAENDAEDAELYLTELQARHEQAVVEEAEAARVEIYEKARAARDKAGKRLEAEYPKLAVALRDLIIGIAEADVLVAQANRDLPDGQASLRTVEALVRDRASAPAVEKSRKRVTRWVDAQRGTVMGGDVKVTPTPGGEDGIVKVETSGDVIIVPVVKRVFFEVTSLAPQFSLPGARLAELALPGLRAGANDIWSPCANGGASVLDAMRNLALKPESSWDREVVVDLVPVDATGGDVEVAGDADS